MSGRSPLSVVASSYGEFPEEEMGVEGVGRRVLGASQEDWNHRSVNSNTARELTFNSGDFAGVPTSCETSIASPLLPSSRTIEDAGVDEEEDVKRARFFFFGVHSEGKGRLRLKLCSSSTLVKDFTFPLLKLRCCLTDS
ncbi:hypothetical protein TrCOL_g11892 [Triparma columacea]|uniref:Uncharacterized protein n=1 Tax=Triparma columacea TaxID=722753 RepID=A0A9W7GAA4_9STRA|nr:hypothetical protein TrCOL_g11892 [Triparma columacea]